MKEKVIVNLNCLIDKQDLLPFLNTCGFIYKDVIMEYNAVEPDHENGGYKEVVLTQTRSVLIKQDQVIATKITQEEFFELSRNTDVGKMIIAKLLELLTKNTQ